MPDHEALPASAKSVVTAPQRSRANHELLNRIYNRSEYTAIVRVIGSQTWDIEDARDLVVPLMKRFGVDRILDATSELLAIESNEKQTTARLTDDVRRFAIQLLGSVGLSVAGSSKTESPRDRLLRLRLGDDASQKPASDYLQVDRKRDNIVSSYERHLTAESIPFRRAKNSDLHELTKPRALSVDFVCERGTERQLTLVRRELTGNVRKRLVKLLQRFGPNYVGVRVWPIGPSKSWMWEKEWIVGNEAPTSRNEQPAAASTVAELTTATQPRPNVQQELF
ncbi:MAG TPA: hypothetical protein VK137_07130 [Planctomycetaceae bacterium]|nr:hypothetical protein [Planctomycetaceae bacterium]